MGFMQLHMHVEAIVNAGRRESTKLVIQNKSTIRCRVTVGNLGSMDVDANSNSTLLLSNLTDSTTNINFTITNLLSTSTTNVLNIPLDALALADFLITPTNILNLVEVILPFLDVDGLLTFLDYLL